MKHESIPVRPADVSTARYCKNRTVPFSMDLLFKTALDCGIITVDDVMNSAREDIMKTILDTVHKAAIKRLPDGRYCTYISDESKPGGRSQIRKKSRTELYRFLMLNQTLPQKDIADLLGHSEKVNEMHYHFSTADLKEKQRALNALSGQLNGLTVIKAG